ncbi:1412_t:CDS:2, partial [Acaulospora colombiana]
IMGNNPSNFSSSGSGGPVIPTPDDYDKRRLTNLYNTPVESAQYLIHSTDASGAQVITEARHMSNNWETVGEVLVPRGNQTVGDLMKTARQDGSSLLVLNKTEDIPSAFRDAFESRNICPPRYSHHDLLLIRKIVNVM